MYYCNNTICLITENMENSKGTSNYQVLRYFLISFWSIQTRRAHLIIYLYFITQDFH